jgi:hypothetical protein
MVKIAYDDKRNAVIIEVEGNVDATQGGQLSADLERILPKDGKGFSLLTDFTLVQTMEPEVEGELKKAMELINSRGVKDILRVLPDPDLDIGFGILTRCFYSDKVRCLIFRSRAQADASLAERSGRAA